MNNIQVQSIIRRFLIARKTKQTERIEAAFDTIRRPLSQVEGTLYDAIHRSRGRGMYGEVPLLDPEKQERGVKELAEASKHVLQDMKMSFENPGTDATKHYKTRFKNLTKMIESWAKVSTWAELEPILMSQHTKSKAITEKFWDYSREFVAFVEAMDTEHEGNLTLGPWTAALFTSPRADWTQEAIGKLKHVLEETTQVLGSLGVGSMSGGKIFAYPTELLPGAAAGTHNAYAFYERATDNMALAVGSSVKQVLKSLVHESGHRVYYKILSGNARSEWVGFFESESGPPDVDHIIKTWEEYSHGSDPWVQKYGQSAGAFIRELREKDPDMLMWFSMILRKLPEATVETKKSAKTGLEVLIENRAKIKVFLHPVTAYSGTNPSELFAEVFAAWGTEGPGRVPEIVRDMFKRVLPQVKMARIEEV